MDRQPISLSSKTSNDYIRSLFSNHEHGQDRERTWHIRENRSVYNSQRVYPVHLEIGVCARSLVIQTKMTGPGSMMAPSTYGSSGCILAEPIPYRPSPVGHFEVSMRLGRVSRTNPSKTTAPEPHEEPYFQLPIATSPPKMGDRLTLPVYDGHSSSRSVSERSERSDSSPERSETSNRSGSRREQSSKEKRKRASRPKVKTGYNGPPSSPPYPCH